MLASVVLLLISLQSAELSAAVQVTAASTHVSAAATTIATNAPTPAGTTKITTTTTTAATDAKTTAKATTTKPVATTTIATTAATTAAKKPRRLCAFPFWHRGQWQHQCLEYGSKGARWCALTQNFTRDEEWRECARYDVLRYKCALPFHHGSTSHTQCQPLRLEPLALPTFWCALVPSVAGVNWRNLGTDWTFCEAPNATDADYLKAVGGHQSLEDAVKVVAVATTASAAASTHGNVAAVLEAPKSISAASSDGVASAGSADASSGSSPSSSLGIVLGIVGVVLAAVAVAAAFIVHRRHQYKRIDPLLSSEVSNEKGSYGGMQAYHD